MVLSISKATVLFTCFVTLFVSGYEEDKIVNLAEKVQKLIEHSKRYQFPLGNEEYYISQKGSDYYEGNGETYDFIIIGTGTAGGVLANRLTEDGDSTVLALEAGDETPEMSDMLGVNIYLHRTKYNWGYNTTEQKNMCLGSIDRKCAYPRGKMLGGSSAINFGMYVRGHHEDYDSWESMGNPGWSYKEVLPYFRKPERATFTDNIDPDSHGFEGLQSISVPEETPLLTQALINAHIDLGKKLSDYNSIHQDEGVSKLQFFLDKNIRSSSNHAFIKPARGRTNLRVSVNSLVTKILIEKDQAYGVLYVKDGKEHVAIARKEVLLCAGSINSPQVLMLSGVGPAEELKKHDIDIVADLPVGQFMQDHQFFPGVFYRTNHTFYNNTLLENVKLWTANKRPLTPSLGQQAISFWNFMGPKGGQPEIEFFFFGPPMVASDLATVVGYTDEYIESFQSLEMFSDIVVCIELLHAKSLGSVTLRSKDPKDFPVIDPNYFSDPEGIDLENMYKGIQAALKLNDTETFKNLHAELVFIPIPDCDGKYEHLSKDWWYCALKTLSSTLFHPVSTTRMGSDPKTSVVNAELKVHGLKGLRVVDAGIFPDHISGHPNAAVVMIAEKASDMIKNEYSSSK